jgi:CheY-like chemotaxis protein/HPt (histidine-containing phosphotransfer) domain-containing protein
MMGGEITLKSGLGIGSTFSFHIKLPIAIQDPALPTLNLLSPNDTPLIKNIALDIEKMASPIKGASVLLVEDNLINQTVAQDFLERAGLHVTLAQNGQEAVAAVLENPFDIVLMDLQMPVMGGFEATQLIRQHPHLCDLPIIAMTAAVLAQDRAACVAAGINDHIAKPIRPLTLMQILLKWVKPQIRHMPQNNVQAMPKNDAWTNLSAELPGFDLEQVLFLLGGNRAKLGKLLQQFVVEFTDGTTRLEQLLRQQQFAEARALVHNIKGASGILGAVELLHIAQQLEAQLSGNDLNPDISAFSLSLCETLNAIAKLNNAPLDIIKVTPPK